MSRTLARLLAALPLLLGALLFAPADATASQIIGFTYFNINEPNPPFASGNLTINDTPEPAGGYLITGITGQHNGDPISGLIAPGDPVFFNDNLFFFSSPHLHSFGFAFTVAGPGGEERYNVFNALSPPNCGGLDEYAELSTASCSDGIQVLFSVPEPGDLGLLAAALLGLATTRRLRMARLALPRQAFPRRG